MLGKIRGYLHLRKMALQLACPIDSCARLYNSIGRLEIHLDREHELSTADSSIFLNNY